nr:retrovirus-related Pol polyprotein from transposon TNT 1-94 [Tanacetum cinerariifolium]
MYALVCTRPDLAHAVSVVSRFMANPGKAHWKALKWILRYLKGASNICLVYDGKGHGDGLVGYADFDYSGDLVKRRSLTCFIFTMFGCVVSWKSTLQPTVALSMTEAEYMSMTEGIKECIWLHGLVQSLGLKVEKPALFCDSQNALSLAKNSVYHERPKHIDVRLNFICDVREEDMFSIQKIATEHNPSYMLTKALPTEKFEHCLNLVNIRRRIATVVAVVQFSRAVQGSKHGGYVDSYGVVNCYILKPGIFAVGAILALFSAIFGIAAYVTGIGAPQTTTNPPIVGVPMGANFDLERNAVPNPTPQYPTPQYPPPQYFPPQ